MQRYVKTDYDGCPYITAGKVYEYFEAGFIFNNDGYSFGIYGPDDKISREHSSSRNSWQWCDKDGNSISENPAVSDIT